MFKKNRNYLIILNIIERLRILEHTPFCIENNKLLNFKSFFEYVFYRTVVLKLEVS